MGIGIIYTVIILFASILGAIVGLGGGVIIRPVFDAIGHHNMLNINFFASAAILTMAVVSTVKKLKDGTEISLKTALLISMGSVAGGMLGNLFIEHLIYTAYDEANVQRVQNIANVVVLVLSLVLTAKGGMRVKVKNRVFPFMLGIFLGAAAIFLGIGGGPINVPLLIIFFGFPMKQAAAYSIVIIFFSHLSRLITIGVTIGYGYFDLPVLGFVIPAAIVGGLIGAKCSNVFSDLTVKRLFMAAITAVIILNLVNVLFLI